MDNSKKSQRPNLLIMDSVDALYPLKTQFYIGAYQNVLKDNTHAQLSPEQQLFRKTLVYRSLVLLGQYNKVIQDIRDTDAPELLAIKLLALQLSGSYQDVGSFLANHTLTPILALVAATVYLHQESLDEALALVVQFPKDMEWYSN